TNIEPAGAATGTSTASGATLTFNNVTITVDPGAYTGRYFIQSHFPSAFVGKQQIVLIPALTYAIDHGTESRKSAFLFDVDASGNVTSQNGTAATGGPKTLTFNTAPVVIDPQTYTGAFFLQSHIPTSFSGKPTVALMPSLEYAVDDGVEVGGSGFLFMVNADGSVASESAASASASGNTLSLANANVVVNPGSYTGTYQLTNYPS